MKYSLIESERMADPISTIGLLGTAATLTKIILNYASAVKDAPKEVETLIRELTVLQNVLEKFAKLLERKESREEFAGSSPVFDIMGVGSRTLTSRARIHADRINLLGLGDNDGKYPSKVGKTKHSEGFGKGL